MKAQFTNLFVKNIAEDVTEDEFKEVFSRHGTVTSFLLARDDEGKSKGFGFVNYEKHDDAQEALDKLHEFDLRGKNLFVTRAQKKNERDEELRRSYEQARAEKQSKYQGVNLYIKNLEDDVDDEKLRAEFEAFGTITSCKVMRDEKGASKGFGFVCYTSPDEATKAVSEMNNKMIGAKPLYVSLAQRKDIRRQQLESQIAQRNIRMQQSMGLPPPGFMGGAPMYYGPPGGPGGYPGGPGGPRGGVMGYPPQPGMGGPPHLGPGGRPRYGPPPGAVPGLPLPAQYGGVPPQGYGVPPGYPPRGVPPPPNAGAPPPRGPAGPNAAGAAVPAPRPGGPGAAPAGGARPPTGPAAANGARPAAAGGAPANPGQPDSSPVNPGALPTVSEQEQKQMLGEVIYMKIYQKHNDLAGKITGMLLEMDNAELLALVDNQPALDAKVQEAISVLEDFQQQDGPVAAA